MFSIKDNAILYFKEIRNGIYAKYLGKTPEYISAILSGKVNCSEIIARALISVRCEIPINDVQMITLLEKYFNKEK